MTGIEGLFPPGGSPEERLHTKIAALERRLSDQGTVRQAYAEYTGAPIDLTASGPAGSFETFGLSVTIHIPSPQFVSIMAMAGIGGSSSGRGKIMVGGTPYPGVRAYAVTPVGFGLTQAYSFPGSPDPANDYENGKWAQSGGWSELWLAAGEHTFDVRNYRPSAAQGGSLTYGHHRLWVRY